MTSTLINNNDQITIDPNQSILFDAQIFSAPGIESETDLDATTVIENLEKQLPIKPTETSTPVRACSGLSISASSTRSQKSKSRSYKFVQLERALTSGNLLKNNEDRIKFENEYLNSIHENKFDEFLQNYYQKIHDHNEYIKQKRELKQARIFTFMDFEKKFLALDPTRNVKIIFLDESTPSTIKQPTNTRPIASARQRSTSAVNDITVESFYDKRSHYLLANPSRARNEITLFARRTAERLQERLPRLSSVPHRVKVVDERDTTGKLDENILLQLKHKHKLSLINKRRHIIVKMMGQSKKNQIKMEEQWNQTPLTIDSSACCRELLERANQIEQVYREEQQIRERPQTAMISRRIINKNISSSATSNITTNTNTIPSLSSCSTPFQDALSIHDVEKLKNVRVIQSTRPVTAPMKMNWINYC